MPISLEDKMINLAKVFSLIENKFLSLKEGSKLLKYSYWHFTKLYKRYKKVGLKDLFKKQRKRKKMKLKDKDVEILKEYYLKLEKPQISLSLYFLKADFSTFFGNFCRIGNKIFNKRKDIFS